MNRTYQSPTQAHNHRPPPYEQRFQYNEAIKPVYQTQGSDPGYDYDQQHQRDHVYHARQMAAPKHEYERQMADQYNHGFKDDEHDHKHTHSQKHSQESNAVIYVTPRSHQTERFIFFFVIV